MSDHEGQQPPRPQPSPQPRSNFRPRQKDPQAVDTPQPQPRKKGRWNTTIGMAAGLIALIAVASLTGNGGKGISMSQVQLSPPPAATEPATAPSATETGTTNVYSPSAGDWLIGVEVLNSKCSGSSGCRTTFRIEPRYVGAVPLPAVGTTQVTYKVEGAADPYSNTFSVGSQGTPSFDGQAQVRTSSSAKLTAVVVDVAYDKNR